MHIYEQGKAMVVVLVVVVIAIVVVIAYQQGALGGSKDDSGTEVNVDTGGSGY